MSSNTETGCGKTVATAGALAAIVGLVIALFAWLHPFSPVGPPPFMPSPTQSRERPTPTLPKYDCTITVLASRHLVAHDTDEACWLKLEDGAPAEVVFRDTAQITYRTTSSGDDIYFYIANIGDRLTDVIVATIRPSRFVIYGFGGYEDVKQFEIEYHSPGGEWVACLRDANNDFQPLNSVCK